MIGTVKVMRQKPREENSILFRDVFKHHIYANGVRNIKGVKAVVTSKLTDEVVKTQ